MPYNLLYDNSHLHHHLPPYFVSDFNDCWLYDVAGRIQRRVYLPHVYTEHMHHIVGKAEIDENTRERLARHEREDPKKLYDEKTNERKADADKLLKYIDVFNMFI